MSGVPVVERSWWLREALADSVEVAAALTGETSAEVCVVGGGFTGLWTALRLKELDPGCDVVVLEADLCGSGASGRNGGFVMTLWHNFLALSRACAGDEAVRLAGLSEEAVASVGAFCSAEGVDASFVQAGWYWAASNSAQLGRWQPTLDAVARCGGDSPFTLLSGEEISARTGSPRHVGGVFERFGATVQPARLALGLREACLARGVRIYEGSAMVGLDRGAVLSVRTAAGRVRARSVVLAMNAWAAGLPELRRRVVTVASDMVVTEPAPERLRSIGLGPGVSVSDTRLMVHYYRPTADGRLAFGKGGGKLAYGGRVGGRYDGVSPRAGWVTEAMRNVYPQLAQVPVAASWTGPVDRTVDGLPFFTPLGRPDLVCGLGYSGNGVGPSWLGGRILASLALGREDEWSRCGLVRSPPGGLPPEPLRYVGGRVVQAAVARRERAEDLGREPSAVDVALARLAPSGLVPVDRAGPGSTVKR